MDKTRKRILKGISDIAEINKKETLRCINEASMMYRDTLRDTDEGDCFSVASNDADPPPSGTSDASTPDPKDLVLFLENGRPDPQYVYPPWTAPDDLWDDDSPIRSSTTRKRATKSWSIP